MLFEFHATCGAIGGLGVNTNKRAIAHAAPTQAISVDRHRAQERSWAAQLTNVRVRNLRWIKAEKMALVGQGTQVGGDDKNLLDVLTYAASTVTATIGNGDIAAVGSSRLAIAIVVA